MRKFLSAFLVVAMVSALLVETALAAEVTITITTPADGASYTLNQAVVADYSCTGIDVATCIGDVRSGSNIDTSAVGSKTFTVTATDGTGSETTKTVTYNVVVYQFSGFLPPLNGKRVVFKVGSTIPVKFQLKDGRGNYVSDAAAKILVDSNPGRSPGRSNIGNNFRYDTTSNQYVFNLSTRGLAKGPHVIYVTLNDGSTYSINITLK